MRMRTLRRAVILGLSLAALPVRGAVPPPESAQEKDAVAYKQAYSLVLGEKWEEARKAMEKLAADFPSSSWIDDARFWKCYSLEKLGQSMEAVFQCYKEVAGAFPQSDWA